MQSRRITCRVKYTYIKSPGNGNAWHGTPSSWVARIYCRIATRFNRDARIIKVYSTLFVVSSMTSLSASTTSFNLRNGFPCGAAYFKTILTTIRVCSGQSP